MNGGMIINRAVGRTLAGSTRTGSGASEKEWNRAGREAPRASDSPCLARVVQARNAPEARNVIRPQFRGFGLGPSSDALRPSIGVIASSSSDKTRSRTARS